MPSTPDYQKKRRPQQRESRQQSRILAGNSASATIASRAGKDKPYADGEFPETGERRLMNEHADRAARIIANTGRLNDRARRNSPYEDKP